MTKKLSVRPSRVGLVCAFFAPVCLVAQARAQSVASPIVLHYEGPEDSFEAVRAGLERELGRPIVPETPANGDRLDVRFAEDGTVSVSFHPAEGSPRSRMVASSPEDRRRLAVWLAGNLARDEAAGLIAQLNPQLQQPPMQPVQPPTVIIVLPPMMVLQPMSPTEPEQRPMELPPLAPQPERPPPALTSRNRYFGVRIEGGISVPLPRSDLSRPNVQIGAELHFGVFSVGIDGSYSSLSFYGLGTVGATLLGNIEAGRFTLGLGGGADVAFGSTFTIPGNPSSPLAVIPIVRTNVRPAVRLTNWLDLTVDIRAEFFIMRYTAGPELSFLGGLRCRIPL